MEEERNQQGNPEEMNHEEANNEEVKEEASAGEQNQAENPQSTPEKGKAKKKKNTLKEIRDWVLSLAAALLVVFLVRSYVFTIIRVDGSSMYPTLYDGDLVLAWRLNYQPETGDVVIVHKETDVIHENIVKRVIATGGQTVELDYDQNAVYVDGVRLEEGYINLEEADPMEIRGDVVSIDVPEGSIFVMGDNRNHSTDSRFTVELGIVDEGYIIGKGLFVFFPFNHLKLL